MPGSRLCPLVCGQCEQLLEVSGWPTGLRGQTQALLLRIEQSLALSETIKIC